MRAFALNLLAFYFAATAATAAAADTTPADQNRSGSHPAGIWKAAVPALPMSSEFDGLDPVGMASGARIKADCSLNWIDPDDGARYCFSSGTSLEFFLEQPHWYIARARAAWHKPLDAE